MRTSQKKARLIGVLEQAYGLAREREGDLDPSLGLDSHLRVLKPGAQLQPSLAANLASALDAYVPALLETRYPRHPSFGPQLTPARITRLVEKFGDIVDAEDKRIAADRDLLKEMGGTLGELGLVRVTETGVHLLEDRTLQDLEKKRQQKGVDAPTAGEVRRWIDETGKMGLQLDALDLVVRCYARHAARTLVRFDRPFEARAGQEIPDDVVLEKPPLPAHAEWARALITAGDTFGVTLAGKALHADNLKLFQALIGARLEAVSAACAKLPGVLRARLGELGEAESADRLRTAVSADRLCASLQGKSGLDQVRALVSVPLETSAKAVGRSIASSAETARTLDDALVFGVFGQLAARRGALPEARSLVESVTQALRQDEVLLPLAPRLRTLAEEGQRVLVKQVVTSTGDAPPNASLHSEGAGDPRIDSPSPGTAVLVRYSLQADGRDAVIAKLRDALAEAETAAASAEDDVKLTGTLVLIGKKKG